MIYKEYGKTGAKVSAVGFGGMRFDTTRSKEENAELLLYAYEKGINYFDTAPMYCNDTSEDIFGIAIKQMADVRDKIYISTKAMPESFDTKEKTIAQIEKSLVRLNVDKIDFFHVWCVRKMSQYELAMKPAGMYEGLLQCKKQGLIDNIVISTHLQGPQVCEIIEKGEFAGVLLGVNILNFQYRWQGVEAASKSGMGVVVMNPLGGGLIPSHEDKLGFLGRANEKPTEAALRFCISCPEITVALNGFTTREHIDTACKAAEEYKPFTRSDMERIKAKLSDNMDSLCTGCGYCLDNCPENIPIANYMQHYNEKEVFGKTDDEMISILKGSRQWQLLADRKARAADCIRCGNCEHACTQHLNIIDRLADCAEWEDAIEDE